MNSRSAFSNRFYAMGTRFHLILPGLDESVGHRLFVQVKREVDRIERKISRFDPQSDLSRLNQVKTGQTARVDEEFFDILKACKTCWEITEGAFDPAVSTVESGELMRSGMQHVHLLDDSRSVKLDADVHFDLGGFGKGYALEKVCDLFRQRGVKHGFVNFGDSSVLAVGAHPAGGNWKIGIRHATESRKSAYVFSVRDASVSTSGNFYIGDHGNPIPHHHIVNPQTGLTDERAVTMSVCARSSLLAELLSTAFLVMRDEQIKRVISLYDNLEAAKVDYSSGKDQPEITEYNSNQSNEQGQYEDQSEKVS
jgi:thiamine biosynthesis lipoprotein